MASEEPGTMVVMTGATGKLDAGTTGTTVVEATIVAVLRLTELWRVTVTTEVAKMVEVVKLVEVMLADLSEVAVVLQVTG